MVEAIDTYDTLMNAMNPELRVNYAQSLGKLNVPSVISFQEPHVKSVISAALPCLQFSFHLPSLESAKLPVSLFPYCEIAGWRDSIKLANKARADLEGA